jgi:hypothetical protein
MELEGWLLILNMYSIINGWFENGRSTGDSGDSYSWNDCMLPVDGARSDES